MEQKISSLSFQEQKALKPKIEDFILECLNGETQQTALDFVAYVKSMKMNPRWSHKNAWDVRYKNGGVCKIYVWDGGWLIRPSFNYNYDDALMAFLAENKLQEIIWNNIGHCRACQKSRCAIKSKIILGKEFKDVCKCVLFQFQNPNPATIECAKKLVDYRRTVITNPEV